MISAFSYGSIEPDINSINVTLNHKSFDVPTGLTQNTVTSFTRDDEGFLWVGTANGLNRYDGNGFTQFYARDNNGLPSSFIRNLLFDNEGHLLVGTDAGVAIYNPHTETFKPYLFDQKISAEPTWAMHNANGLNYIGLKNELYIIEAKTSKLIEVIIDESLNDIKKVLVNDVGIYARNYNGDLFLYSQGELALIDKGVDNFSLSSIGLLTLKSGRLYHKGNVVSEVGLTNLTEVGEDKLIGIGKTGLYQIEVFSNDRIKITKIGEPKFDLTETTSSVIYYENHNFYFSDYLGGYELITKRQNVIKTLNTGIKQIWSLSQNTENVFVATNKSITVYDNNFRNPSLLSTDKGFKVILATNNHLFIGDDKGLVKQELGTENRVQLYDKSVLSLTENAQGQIIAGTRDGKVFAINPDDTMGLSIETGDGHPVFAVQEVLGRIYIASQKGLFAYDKAKQELDVVYGNEFVTSLLLHGDIIYFGTQSAVFKHQLSSRITSKVMDVGKVINSIAVLYNELIVTSGTEINALSLNDNKLIKYTNDNGVLQDYSPHSTLLWGRGLLLGGEYGLSYYSKPRLDYENNNGKTKVISIKDLYVFNQKVPLSSPIITKPIRFEEGISLSYSDYPFTFEYGVIGDSSEWYDFYYRLEGIDDIWLPNKNSVTATYTSVPYGDYTFKVLAINKKTGVKIRSAELKVHISPPLWLSHEAKFLYGFFTFIAIFLLSRQLKRNREAQEKIKLSEERLTLSLWGSGDELWDWDIENRQIYRSNIWESIEFPRDGVRASIDDHSGVSNIHPHDIKRVSKVLNACLRGESTHFESIYRVMNKDGQWIWIHDRAKVVERNLQEQPVRMTGTFKDISAFKLNEDQLRLFVRAVDNISEGVFILDHHFKFVEVNDACCKIALKNKQDFIGTELNFSRYPSSYSNKVKQALLANGQWIGEVGAIKGDQTTFDIEVTIDAIYDESNQISHFVGVFSDITIRKQHEEELRRLTNNDYLTGLLNRSSLQVSLNNLVFKQIEHTLMVLDLDNFKRINDSLGHNSGDLLLVEVAKRFKEVLSTKGSLYRLGGDEFAVLIDRDVDVAKSALVASSLINALEIPFVIDSESIVLTVSVGIVLFPEDECFEEGLLKKADIAMYHAKTDGGGKYQFYSESINKNAAAQLNIENLLRDSIKNDYFEVYYQPKINVMNNNIDGMEALVRLNHPEKGIILPSSFIPLAEESGLIVDIGELVLRKACFDTQHWIEKGIFAGRVAVNISSRQFAQPDLQQRIASVLRLTQLSAKNLELEITEGTVIKDPNHAINVMKQIAATGVSLALDDFGTGYSSLAYLKLFPIQTLKIDKSFIDDIDQSTRDLKMVDSIVTIAHNLGLKVVAEGVENVNQYNMIKALGCELIQGHLYSKPLTDKEFENLLLSSSKMNTFDVNQR
ncbi:diguanylate cyclase [Shewanella inventionis]|uniref:Diguanylate cyclase n=1 Tax=Shewanella inventionis TaxID=1738770 RepID=A0ABQ1IWW0_9GAMM|nr:diguanylate cyclase [Shewanella inventionis]